ncbi:hypothetical protein [Actinoplanes regularis]|uniref:Uncharacterized protein n=1 Tax=Actinoplanes regularis TaxID=52697 RepID=A0A239JYQ0_9ACTN|nr:hypothetical protein [Actinoplanes regularis]GIE92371.1 hypothetical protein Are01nite_88510 [Actinoplanes regularis]SNT10920.1 hypothetical protein SAMN06264365_14013 [Actinoplanes regularis]
MVSLTQCRNLPAFLAEAHRIGVLCRRGAVHQLCRARLCDSLADIPVGSMLRG